MKNIHILPTDKPSRYALKSNGEFVLSNYLHPNSPNFTNYHIYITSDEEIKEGDWGYSEMDGIGIWNGPILIHEGLPKKIILTTDQDLIKDGVQAIDDEFLEWFVKNPSCETIDVRDIKTIPALQLTGNNHLYYKMIIPKEKPKQETLEEAAEKYATDISGTYYEELDNSFKEGAKWQQERMYSEDDMIMFANFFHDYKELLKKEKWEILEMSKEDIFKKWIEKVKKK